MDLAIDHFLLGIRDLKKGTKEFENLTGVRPVFGGIHPNTGTQNALASLGKGMYLEIIAPVDPSKTMSGPFEAFNRMDRLSLFAWAIGTPDLQPVLKYLEENNIPNSGENPGSRKTPDGEILHWSTSFLLEKNEINLNPFFISWDKTSLHPSISSPNGCTLKTAKIAFNEKPAIQNLLQKSNLNIPIIQTDKYSISQLLRLVLNTPKGEVEFNLL